MKITQEEFNFITTVYKMRGEFADKIKLSDAIKEYVNSHYSSNKQLRESVVASFKFVEEIGLQYEVAMAMKELNDPITALEDLDCYFDDPVQANLAIIDVRCYNVF